MATKKTTLIISFVASLIFLVSDFVGTDNLCGGREYTQCMQSVNSSLIVFFPVLPVFIFSLITYKMRDEIYVAWFKFVRWWIPLSMILIFLSPDYSSNILSPVEKGSVALLVSAIFFVVSTLLILWKWNALRKN